MRIRISIILSIICFSLSASDLSESILAFESGDLEAAETLLLQQWEADDHNDSIAYYLGRVYQQRDDHNNAVHWLEEAVELNAGSSLYHTWLGRVLGVKALNSNIINKARLAGRIKSEFQKAVQLDSGRIDARWDLLQFYLQAPGIMGGGTDKAMDVANAITGLDSLNGYFAVGLVLRQEHAMGEAVALYTKGILKYPSDQNLMLNLAWVYFEDEKIDSTYLTLQNYHIHHPDSLMTLYQIGRLASATGSYLTEGEIALKRFLEHQSPDNKEWTAWAWYHLGQIHEKMKRHDDALSDYRLALTFLPDHEQADQALQKLMKE